MRTIKFTSLVTQIINLIAKIIFRGSHVLKRAHRQCKNLQFSQSITTLLNRKHIKGFKLHGFTLQRISFHRN